LVVIAIIAILAAILFPVFAKAREKARGASCQSNMKQIGLGIMQYAQDYDETYPCGRTSWIPGPGWAGQIGPYLKSAQIFGCPSHSQTVGAGLAKVSYAYNIIVAANPGLARWDSPATTIALTEAGNPAGGVNVSAADEAGGPRSQADYGDNLVWYDAGGGNACCTAGYYRTGPWNDVTRNNSTLAQAAHMEGANYAMLDGHVKWLKGSAASMSAAVGGAVAVSLYR